MQQKQELEDLKEYANLMSLESEEEGDNITHNSVGIVIAYAVRRGFGEEDCIDYVRTKFREMYGESQS